MRKIQELGSLPPPSELESYTHMGISELMRHLETVNKNLKKYSHVNKKAYDQYVNFSEQRDSLLKRKEELDKGAEKVKELIESLDRQKDEAINRTFRGVSSHFKDVFKELVPNGAGELIMKMAMDIMEEDEGEIGAAESQETEEAGQSGKEKAFDKTNPDVSLYRGVAIKVRFTALGENFLMSQLSGGQKALVALALIFAIQRCDPAPFYIFDELDQALDSTYRAAVANVIQRQTRSAQEPAQFIVTTFRPELVAVADECFGISHQNKASSLHPLSKHDALKFVANLMSEEEAVGEVCLKHMSFLLSSSPSSHIGPPCLNYRLRALPLRRSLRNSLAIPPLASASLLKRKRWPKSLRRRTRKKRRWTTTTKTRNLQARLDGQLGSDRGKALHWEEHISLIGSIPLLSVIEHCIVT